ncbi:MAG TPA: hypothetical protein VMU66_09865, partial [Gaiellales bacterium]|nr:hypothetical protein [Gaiellales bacterium]
MLRPRDRVVRAEPAADRTGGERIPGQGVEQVPGGVCRLLAGRHVQLRTVRRDRELVDAVAEQPV